MVAMKQALFVVMIGMSQALRFLPVEETFEASRRLQGNDTNDTNTSTSPSSSPTSTSPSSSPTTSPSTSPSSAPTTSPTTSPTASPSSSPTTSPSSSPTLRAFSTANEISGQCSWSNGKTEVYTRANQQQECSEFCIETSIALLPTRFLVENINQLCCEYNANLYCKLFVGSQAQAAENDAIAATAVMISRKPASAVTSCTCNDGYDPLFGCTQCLPGRTGPGCKDYEDSLVQEASCDNTTTCFNQGYCNTNGGCTCYANYTGSRCEQCRQGSNYIYPGCTDSYDEVCVDRTVPCGPSTCSMDEECYSWGADTEYPVSNYIQGSQLRSQTCICPSGVNFEIPCSDAVDGIDSSALCVGGSVANQCSAGRVTPATAGYMVVCGVEWECVSQSSKMCGPIEKDFEWEVCTDEKFGLFCDPLTKKEASTCGSNPGVCCGKDRECCESEETGYAVCCGEQEQCLKLPEPRNGWRDETIRKKCFGILGGRTTCAVEGSVCTCTGTVFYGANGVWTSRQSVGSIRCSNAVFGDPLIGVRKSCECAAGGQSSSTGSSAAVESSSTGKFSSSPTAIVDIVFPLILVVVYLISTVLAIAFAYTHRVVLFLIMLCAMFFAVTPYWGWGYFNGALACIAVVSQPYYPRVALGVMMFSIFIQLFLWTRMLPIFLKMFEYFGANPRNPFEGQVQLADAEECAAWFGNFKRALELVPWDEKDPAMQDYWPFFGLCSYNMLLTTKVAYIVMLCLSVFMLVGMGVQSVTVPAQSPAGGSTTENPTGPTDLEMSAKIQ